MACFAAVIMNPNAGNLSYNFQIQEAECFTDFFSRPR
jgi:hypothetical protein